MKHDEHCWKDGTATDLCLNGCGVRQGDPGWLSECAKADVYRPCEKVLTPDGTYVVEHYDGFREQVNPPVPNRGYWCGRVECRVKWESRPPEERLKEGEP